MKNANHDSSKSNLFIKKIDISNNKKIHKQKFYSIDSNQ